MLTQEKPCLIILDEPLWRLEPHSTMWGVITWGAWAIAATVKVFKAITSLHFLNMQAASLMPFRITFPDMGRTGVSFTLIILVANWLVRFRKALDHCPQRYWLVFITLAKILWTHTGVIHIWWYIGEQLAGEIQEDILNNVQVLLKILTFQNHIVLRCYMYTKQFYQEPETLTAYHPIWLLHFQTEMNPNCF